MKPSSSQFKCLCSLVILVLQTSQASSGTRFSSHVTVNTPAISYSHGVGDPLPASGRRWFQPIRPAQRTGRHHTTQNHGGGGYPRTRPTIPFTSEEKLRSHKFNHSPRQQSSFEEIPIPVLPPSPYKVDSPDPESLWPEGLFLPPLRPFKTMQEIRRADSSQVSDSLQAQADPYLLEGSEAVAAVHRATDHGLYYFHDIPHIRSLLANQDLRVSNDLEPHRLGSIRHTWPYNRP